MIDNVFSHAIQIYQLIVMDYTPGVSGEFIFFNQ